MKHSTCLFIGGGHLDGFIHVPDSVTAWTYYSFCPPGWDAQEKKETLPVSATVAVKTESYYRVERHVFVHESEASR